MAAQSSVTALSVFLLFLAALEFFHAWSPQSGLGAQLVETSEAIVNTIIASTVTLVFPALDRAAALYMLMILSFIAAMSASARDGRVHLVSLLIAAATLTAMYLYSQDVVAAAQDSAPAETTAFAVLSLVCGAALLGITISFKMRHVPRRKSEFVERQKEKFLMFYWGLVAVFCIFQFFFLMTGPQASQEDASSAIMIIAGTAALFLLGLYMIASVLMLAQIIIWNGMFALNEDVQLSYMEIARHPFPSAVDPAMHPAASLTFLGIIALAWLGYSICAVSGAVNTMRLAIITLTATLSAASIVLVAAFL